MANGEWRIGMNVERSDDKILSRPACLAGGNGVSGAQLPAHSRVPKRGDVRTYCSDPSLGGIDTGEYRGRSRSGEYPIVYPISAYRSGFLERVGDTLTTCGAGRRNDERRDNRANATMRSFGKDDSLAHSIVAGECQEALIRMRAIRHSPFAIRVGR